MQDMCVTESDIQIRSTQILIADDSVLWTTEAEVGDDVAAGPSRLGYNKHRTQFLQQ